MMIIFRKELFKATTFELLISLGEILLMDHKDFEVRTF